MIGRSRILSPALHVALAEIGQKLARSERIGDELVRAVDLMSELSPADIAHADSAIADAALLHHHRQVPSRVHLWLRFRTDEPDMEQLLRTPGLENLFIFHRDGRLREAALLRLSGRLPNPFLFAAVAWRLNDWALPVRAAAVLCAHRCFPATLPAIVAASAKTLLVRQLTWGRWANERQPLAHAFNRVDVAECLASSFIESRTGPMATTLRYALRSSAIDVHLDAIAREAVQPSVRAVALAMLIDGRAKWPSGYTWEWIDKSMGLRRRVMAFDQRALDIATPTSALIARGVTDRSATVRRVALDGVMRHLLGSGEGRDYAAQLVEDRSLSVRQRAAFILRRS
jgi:hypothetical protein